MPNLPILPTPARPFGADALTCALALTGTNTPTPAKLDAALLEMYPVGGPTAASLVAAGWLVPAVSDRTRLRQPPLSLAEIDARLAAAEEPDQAPSFDAPALPASSPEAGPAAPLFSYYRGPIRNTTPHAAINLGQLYGVLISPYARAATETLRAAPVGSPQRAELKQRLDCVTPAGVFTRRANNALETPSGLMVLDFDHVPDLAAARAALLADDVLNGQLLLLFTSPSGDGLKAFVRTDPTTSHLNIFRGYANYLSDQYAALGLVPDEAGKDVARACFVSYDPVAWLSPTWATALAAATANTL